MPVKSIFILALLAALITSWSLIEPPGWTIVLTPALIRVFMPSAKGKKASDAAIQFLIFEDWNCFAFWTAILQLSNLLGWPAPIPNEEKQKLLESISLENKVKTLDSIISFYLFDTYSNNNTVQ